MDAKAATSSDLHPMMSRIRPHGSKAHMDVQVL